MKVQYDVAIIGAGLVGSVQALLLANNGFKVLLLDLFPESDRRYLGRDNKINLDLEPDLRMSALTLKSEDILSQLEVWEQVKSRSGLMQQTHVWEQSGPGEISFDSLSIGSTHLSTIVENDFLLELVTNKIIHNSNITLHRPCRIKNIYYHNNYSEINLEEICCTVKLVIGADGANSWVRNYFNYGCETDSYEHSALVTNVYTEKPHNNIAYQCFLQDGPLAFLPWQDTNCCSIVWSQSHEQAKSRIEYSEQEFKQELNKICSHQLGKVVKISKRASFPLIMRHVSEYYKEGSVLIGDAAHTIHPLAGQGLNLGIYDAYALAKVLISAKQKQFNISSDAILKKYQLQRRGHNQQMINLMSFFKNIYGSDNMTINVVRNLGSNLLDNFGFAKRQIAQYAAGLSVID